MDLLKNRARLGAVALAMAAGVLAGSATAASNTVDVMFVYTPGAAQYGGDMQTRLNQYIAQSNQAYQISGVDLAIRMVHSYQSSNPNYTYTGNTALNEITYNDGTVHALRDQYGADFVGLLNMAPSGLCGVGWLGGSQNGVITSYSKSMAYSSSAIDCGYLTFTHELGHNFGLMHSRRQGDTSGGHHAYGMGYGVDYSFATIMAYAYLFNTSYTYRFSNPRQTCNGVPCGDAATADASRSLGIMASQYPGYRPTRVDDTPPDGADDVIPVPPQGANILINPSFEGSLDGWVAAHGSTLSLSNVRRKGGSYSAQVGSRGTYAAGLAQDISGKLQLGKAYEFGMWVRLQGATSDTARVVLEVNNGERYVDLGRFGVRDTWTEVKGEFVADVPAGSRVRLLVYGPAAGVSFNLDGTRIEPKGATPDPNLVSNGDFEGGNAASWSSTYAGALSVVTDGYNSTRSLRVSNRSQWYDGAGQILAAVKPGVRYRASAQFKLAGSSDYAQLWLLISDDAGSRWQRISSTPVSNGVWAPIGGEFTFTATGTLRSVSLHAMGPNGGKSFQLDDVSVVPL